MTDSVPRERTVNLHKRVHMCPHSRTEAGVQSVREHEACLLGFTRAALLPEDPPASQSLTCCLQGRFPGLTPDGEICIFNKLPS